ncbi:organomercurial transporter MerC [Elongatibacter sediminis]|uniref:Organomercurial transporter MerC n=1 Tax=Elongatibacter sediminis TaxID=3119006 RepID=A0AAW9RHC3_9GAMM
MHAPKFAEKFAALGTVVAALGCAACFPALGALGASLGLGFLATHEGLLINKLLPVFAALALGFNLLYWWRHRVHWRGLLALLGPSAVLLTLYPLWRYGWSTYLFYAALALMLSVSILDVIKPPRPPTCPQ